MDDAERCSCGGRIEIQSRGPGQAVAVCVDCGEIADIVWHNPPRPDWMTCDTCGQKFPTWVTLRESICGSCRPAD